MLRSLLNKYSLLAVLLTISTFLIIYQTTSSSSINSVFAILRSPTPNPPPSPINATTTTTSASPPQIPDIPNILHFVYLVKDPNAALTFKFGDYLSMYAAWHYMKPETIYLHTDASDDQLQRAANGQSGKWSKLLLGFSGLQIISAVAPTHTKTGNKISAMEHKSDFVRVEAVRRYGGLYIDFDVFVLRDIKGLRYAGFKAVAGRQVDGQVNSGVFMADSKSKLINFWAEGMHYAYNGGWTTHSNDVITNVSERLVPEPGEMLIMEREAFAPGSWNAEDCISLFKVQPDAPPNLDAIDSEGDLPTFEATDILTSWNDTKPDAELKWATDWSRTYMIHAFSPHRFGGPVEGYDQVTPRYVLDRRSNLARALYPTVKQMYDIGLIKIDDPYL